MEMDQIVQIIKNNAPEVLEWFFMALGALVVIGYTYVKATPTKEDDKWVERLESKPIIGLILKFLVKFSPVARKENLEKFDDEDAKTEAVKSEAEPVKPAE
jgi:hypothetical protein